MLLENGVYTRRFFYTDSSICLLNFGDTALSALLSGPVTLSVDFPVNSDVYWVIFQLFEASEY